MTITDQWGIVIVPKARLSESNKLNTIGSHPQRVTDPKMMRRLKNQLLDMTFHNEEDPFVVLWKLADGLFLVQTSSSVFVRSTSRRLFQLFVYIDSGSNRDMGVTVPVVGVVPVIR